MKNILRTVLGFFAASALVFSFVPAFALAGSSSYYNYDYCNSYPYYNYDYQYDYSYQNNWYPNCQRGTLTVYVQVNHNYNPGDRNPQDFSVSVSGQNVSRPSFPGSNNGTTVYLNGSYNVTVSPFQGYTPTYSTGCTGNIYNNSHASCYITMNPTAPYPHYPYPQYPQYPYPGYTNPVVYVTPTYVPKLPNTGFDPNSGMQTAALVVLVATALLSLPYVRKAFASILG